MHASSVDTSGLPPALVLVAKAPLRGVSKTRLIPLLGEDAAYELARAMLLDILHLGRVASKMIKDLKCILYFAPSSQQHILEAILAEEGLGDLWALVQMPSEHHDLRSIDLSFILSHALTSIAPHHSSLTFIGSDTPQLAVPDIAEGVQRAAGLSGYILPAADGGYVLLSLPSECRDRADTIFGKNVRWSSENTLRDQLLAIESAGLPMVQGPSYCDIDTFPDIENLVSYCDAIERDGGAVGCPRSLLLARKYSNTASKDMAETLSGERLQSR